MSQISLSRFTKGNFYKNFICPWSETANNLKIGRTSKIIIGINIGINLWVKLIWIICMKFTLKLLPSTRPTLKLFIILSMKWKKKCRKSPGRRNLMMIKKIWKNLKKMTNQNNYRTFLNSLNPILDLSCLSLLTLKTKVINHSFLLESLLLYLRKKVFLQKKIQEKVYYLIESCLQSLRW